MIRERLKSKISLIFGVVTAATLSLFFVLVFFPMVTRAIVAPVPCAGNICTGEIIVGGQTVQYAYTQHIQPNGLLKVRFNAGIYNTGTLISHMIHNLPAFTAWNKYTHPTSGAIFLPDEDINPVRTAYERLKSDGCDSCIVDQVLTVSYAGLAPGSYTFSLSVFHNGASGTRNNLVFYVDAAAPTGGNESEVWGAIPGLDAPCADSFDNDLNYYSDCSDIACVGSVGRVADGAICQSPEVICSDDFDNDGDGLVDCLDNNCNGQVGRIFDGALCQYENERGAVSCSDNFDNDGDGLIDCLDNLETIPGQSCWKQPGSGCPLIENCATGWDDDEDMSYLDNWDDQPLTGINCQDYDCFENAVCPSVEHRTAAGDDADLQCFNGLDDDLDGLTDCGDPDCLGMDDGAGSPNMCFESEFNLVERYQLCNNYFNDDGDASYDCADVDCRRRFGNCGPCPEREDLTYASCADGTDDDSDGAIDCADADCINPGPGPMSSLGYLANAARCSAAENSHDLCSDSWDNDADGQVDCADVGCLGFRGGWVDTNFDGLPDPVWCEAVETSCGDRFDNDLDGFIDCMDSDCWGLGGCSPSNISAACQIVPRLGSFTAFSSVDPTITGAATVATHVNSVDTIRLIGSGLYTSITIVIGDNTDDNAVYPYADPACVLSGQGADQLAFTQVPERVIHLYNLSGEIIDGFNLTLTCPTPAEPQGWQSFPISISVLKSPGDQTETGDRIFNYVLYEDTQPTINIIEAEGEGPVGSLTVERGAVRRFRVSALDPDLGIGSSGICSCTVEVDGIEYATADGNCVTGVVSGALFDDGVINVRARAEDGVNNIGNYTPLIPINVNVTPHMIDPNLTAVPAGLPAGWQGSPFFKDGQMDLDLEVRFETANSDAFLLPSCAVWIRDRFGNVIGGPPGPTANIFGDNSILHYIHCVDTITLPVGIPDGEYFVTVSVTDEDGDTAFSNRQVIYVCNNKPRPGDPESVCSWADFDGDGASEGLYSNLYAADFKACDNCVNLHNPDQIDRNANGVGEACEPDRDRGRCELDREVVCEVGLNPLECNPPDAPDLLCCPVDPLIGEPEQCIEEWGLCLHDFDYCFDDMECGWCEDAGLPTNIGCREDQDCLLAGLSGPCASGNGYCEDDPLESCRRDDDCVARGLLGPCLSANICDQLIFPWLETMYGNIFSQKKITAPVPPPENRFSATYCITAKGSIQNFTSELCGLESNPDINYERPKQSNAYVTILGKIDLTGLLAGRYGDIVTSTPVTLDNNLSALQPLAGRVIVVEAAGADVVVNFQQIKNAGLNGRGNGTVIIVGGDLYLNGNLVYEATPVDRLHNLASLGWIVLPQADGTKGNVFVNGNVKNIVGSFLVGGEEGFDSVAPPLEGSEVPLSLFGLVVARKLHLDRTLRNPDTGAERFIYDGRAVANPPPGFADIGKSLPMITDTP
ncbi:hypothetical protein KKF05_00645 [Patescibacteria group bacterium]|nr:hypothetical protein [Patescibacteria group bacterium]